MSAECSLKVDPIKSVLAELHAEAYRDRFRFVRLVPRMLSGFLRGNSGFVSTTLHIADGFEYSVYTG